MTLVRRLGSTKDDVDHVRLEAQRLRNERSQMLGYIAAVRRNHDEDLSAVGKVKNLEKYISELCAEGYQLRQLQDQKERENQSLLRELIFRRRRRLLYPLRSPLPKRGVKVKVVVVVGLTCRKLVVILPYCLMCFSWINHRHLVSLDSSHFVIILHIPELTISLNIKTMIPATNSCRKRWGLEPNNIKCEGRRRSRGVVE